MGRKNLVRKHPCWYVLLALPFLRHADGVVKFIRVPPNPSYATNGSNAKLVWDYSVDNKQAELRGIVFNVHMGSPSGFVQLLVQQKDGTVVEHPNIPSAYKGRVKMEGNATLVIENISPQDQKKFLCQIFPESGQGLVQRNEVQLLVTVEPQIITIPSVQASYNEGTSVNISCTASGTPNPVVKWIRNGNVRSSGKNAAFLTFSSINRTDAGQYICRANNIAGSDENHVTLVVYYPPTIQVASTSSAKSWIGQKVTLKCLSDGVPTPTLTWYKPDGSQINSVRATLNTVNVKMEVDQDFGGYKCDADNGLTPADYKIVKVQQIKEPDSPDIRSSASDILATSLTVKWTAPADDGGSPITAYRVVILKTGTEIKNENITDPGTTSLPVGGLERNTEYTVRVFARNAVFEGPAGEMTARTKYEGVPAAATIEDLPSEVTDDTITLKWSKPLDNGKEITQYIVYQRIVTDGKPGQWKKLETIYDISVRELAVELERGKVSEFVVTAINELGESLKEHEKIMRVKASEKPDGGDDTQTGGGEEDDGVGATVYAGAAAAVVLFIVGVIAVMFLWRRRKASGHDRRLPEELGSENPIEMEDGYQSVSREAAQSLQPSGLAVEAYANVDLSKKIKRTPQKNATAYALELDEKSSSMALPGGSTIYEFPSGGEYMPLHPSGRRWEIKREQVKIMKVIGKGAFSQVAKATASNIRSDEEYTTVAVKMLKANAPESDRKDLLSELELMKKLKPHPHVIKLMGCVTKTDPLLVLIEYVPFGDLLGYLRKSRGLKDTYYKHPDVKPKTSLTAEQLIRFAWQIADGMFYLSTKKIIHRDLAARNVLVGEGEKCKVTDFGMARNVHQDDIYTRRSRGRLPVKWTAYEALLYGTYTTQSDVWSYGILLYEILTVGGSPYPGINARQIANKLQEGFRMPKPKHVDNKLYQIMLKCWDENPSNRPTFAKLKNTMKDMERNNRTYVNLNQYDNSLYANVEDLTA